MIRGRISIRDEDAPSLIAEEFALLEQSMDTIPAFPILEVSKKAPDFTLQTDSLYLTEPQEDDVKDLSSSISESDIINDQNNINNIVKNEKTDTIEQKTLVIHLQCSEESDAYRQLLAMLEFFHGETSVKIVFDNTKVTRILPNEYRISFCNDTIAELMKRFGKNAISLE